MLQDPPEAGRAYAIGVYVLFVVACFTGMLPALAGIAMVYTNRREAGPLVRSHFDAQIRVFWFGFGTLLLAALATLLTWARGSGDSFRIVLGIGLLVFAAFVLRNVIGLVQLLRGRPA